MSIFIYGLFYASHRTFKTIINGLNLMNFMKILFSMFVLFTQAANAGFLTLNFEATDYIERISNYDSTNALTHGDIDYTSISPTNFELNYNIDFDVTPSDSRLWELVDHKGWREESDRDGKHYSTFNSTFRADLLTSFTPFTAQLQALMPEMDEFPNSQSFSRPHLWFFSTVVSDLSTGEIILEDSYESFWLSDGFGFSNSDDIDYDYDLSVWLTLPTIFTSTEANSYDVQEIKDMLTNRQDYRVRFNETQSTTTWEGSGFTSTKSRVDVGYVGNGTHTFDVPEPSSIVIFTLGLMGLVSRRFKKS